MSGGIANGNIIETNRLTKFYGSLKAVDKVSLSVKQGEIYGFLGLNGAGKTTTIRMLLGMIHASAGEASVCGKKILPGREGPWERIGYLVELPYAYPELTVKENLVAASRLRGIKGEETVLRIIGQLKLEPYARVRTRTLSLGNNQRLGLAKALIHNPDVLVLDEPSNGLDPAGIVEIRELLKSLAHDRGTTVFISSHNLDEIARLATRIGIIHKGALVQEIDADMLDSVLHASLVIDVRDRTAAAAFLADKGFGVERSAEGMIRITDQKAFDRPESVNAMLVQAGFPPFYLEAAQESLESYFLRLIGESSC